MHDQFAQKKDSGRLMATQSKKKETSPDYWGEIAIDIKDMTKVEVKDGLHIFRINGWKKRSKTGAVYLSLSVDRWIPTQTPQPTRNEELDDGSDLPF